MAYGILFGMIIAGVAMKFYAVGAAQQLPAKAANDTDRLSKNITLNTAFLVNQIGLALIIIGLAGLIGSAF